MKKCVWFTQKVIMMCAKQFPVCEFWFIDFNEYRIWTFIEKTYPKRLNK